MKLHQNEFMLFRETITTDIMTQLNTKMLVLTVLIKCKSIFYRIDVMENLWVNMENAFSFLRIVFESEVIICSNCDYFGKKFQIEQWIALSHSIKSSTCSAYLFAKSFEISKSCFHRQQPTITVNMKQSLRRYWHNNR